MKERASVLDISSNYEENITRWAADLGANKIRRKIFNVIYGRKTKPRSKKQLMDEAGIASKDEQQVQNALEALVGKHLVLRIDNDGSVQDGSRYLYTKEQHVRVHKDRIVQLADNKPLAERITTKRKPVLKIPRSLKTVVTRRMLKKRRKLGVLYLTANPDEKSQLRVDAEMRQVQDAVRGSKLRDNVQLHYRPAADLDSLIDGLNDHIPRIVHFSGHGSSQGIGVDHANVRRPNGKFVTFDLLSKALSAVDCPPEVMVLNSCNSAGARKSFLPPAKAIIVMQNSISDLAATAFAAKFYAAIAAGQSLKSAFEQGKLAIEATSINEASTPQLISAKGIDPARLILS